MCVCIKNVTHLNQVRIDVVYAAALQNNAGMIVRIHIPIAIQAAVRVAFRFRGAELLLFRLPVAGLTNFLEFRKERLVQSKLPITTKVEVVLKFGRFTDNLSVNLQAVIQGIL